MGLRPAPPLLGRGSRVLVADPFKDAARTLAMVLRLHGHDVRTAFTAADTARLLVEFRPRFVLAEVGMIGEGFAGEVRRLQGAAGEVMTLATLSAWTSEDDRMRAEAAGFRRHFVKPVRVDDLLELFNAGDGEERSN